MMLSLTAKFHAPGPMVEGVSRFLNVVLWSPQVDHSASHIQLTHTHTQIKLKNKIKLKTEWKALALGEVAHISISAVGRQRREYLSSRLAWHTEGDSVSKQAACMAVPLPQSLSAGITDVSSWGHKLLGI